MCAVELIQDDERIRKEIGGSVFYYRRLPADKKARFIARATKRGGVTDFEKVAKAGLEYVVLDWEGVNQGGKPIAFDPALISKLPESVREELVEAAFEGGLGADDGLEGDPDPLDD